MDNKFLSKDQVKSILDNAPANLDKEGIIKELVTQGFTLEGFQSAPTIQEKNIFNTINDQITGGLKSGAESIINSVNKGAEAIQDTDASVLNRTGRLLETGLNVVGEVAKTAVTPITATLEPAVAPLIQKIATIPGVSENISKVSEWAKANPQAAQDLQSVFDIATLGGGTVAESGAKTAAKVVAEKSLAGVDNVANKISNVTSSVTDTAKSLKPNTKLIGDFIEDVKPKTTDIRDRAIAKALRLAPVEDLSTFKQLSGEDMGDFMSRNNLIKDTPAETAEAIKKFQRENFDLTRDAISLVNERYGFDALPEIDSTIDVLLKDVAGRKSREFVQVFNKLSDIKKKGDFDLLDAQYVKEVFDDLESVYKRTGEVKDSVGSEDLAQLVRPIRTFIEDRVKEQYPQVDIRGLNKNVQSSRAILDSIVKRASKADTSSVFQLGDFAVIGLGNQLAPGAGFPALFTKKVVESAPVRLRLAQAMAKRAKNQAIERGDIVKGLTPKDIEEMKALLTKELKDAMDEGDLEIIKDLKDIKSKID